MKLKHLVLILLLLLLLLMPMTGLALDIDVDGNNTVDLNRGGTNSALVDPNADRLLFWDDSESLGSNFTFLTYDSDDFAISTTTFSLVAEIPHLDVGETILGNWVNTAHPWVDNEMADIHSHAADAIDAITEIAAALKSGSDVTIITGTKGTDTYYAVWNADGDLVDGAGVPALQSVLGTSIGNGLLLDGAVLKTSAILQEYHANNPSAFFLTLTDDADGAAVISTLGLTLNSLTFDVGSVSKTEFGYLNGVTSNLQDQLDSGGGRLSQGLTAVAFTGSDATPDVTNGGATVVQYWQTADTTTITHLDDGGDDSQLADGDTVFIQCLHAAVFEFSDNANLKGHGNNNYTCGAGEWVLCVYDDTNSYWVCKPSETKATNFSTLRVPNDESADGTLANLGEVHVRGDEDRYSMHMGAGGEIAGEATKSMLEYGAWSCDPGSAYDSDAEWFLFKVDAEVWPNGIIIDEWSCSCNVDPDVEINADLRYADAWIGLANAADIDEIDTTSGTSTEDTDASINSGAAVAAGKVVYIGHDGDPEGTCVQMVFEMKWHGEED